MLTAAARRPAELAGSAGCRHQPSAFTSTSVTSGKACTSDKPEQPKGLDLEAGDDRLHPGVPLQLLDGDVTQGVGVLPLAAALRHAQKAVQVKGYNAREPYKPAYTGWCSSPDGVGHQTCGDRNACVSIIPYHPLLLALTHDTRHKNTTALRGEVGARSTAEKGVMIHSNVQAD
ncbi:MAG: hypothetical protein FRX49_03067 [Trebouxia sp. A1-2]|nr:MAG: hypothetical protein FRX49_03067 [Trebouxia sp. A1-2]